MFVPTTRRVAAFAAFVTAVAGLATTASAQGSLKDAMAERNLRKTVGANAVPIKRYPGIGDSRFLPSDVPARSLAGVTGFDQAKKDQPGNSRVQIGGNNGANVQEQVVNITNSAATDQLTPYWTLDEQFLFYASKLVATEGYQIRRAAAGAVNNPLFPGNAVDTAISNQPNADHLFPILDSSSNRIAFIKSTDGQPIGPTKQWHLYVSQVPVGGATIDPNPGGPNNLLAVTIGRTFRGAGFDTIGRVAWIGPTQLIFSGRLVGQTNFHLFTVSLVNFQFQQLTSGPASEENPTVSPDGRWVAFDSNATFQTSGSSYSGGTAPATESSAGDPAVATGLSSTGRRNIFIMPTSGVGVPTQFTGRFAGAPDVNNVQPSWSTSRANPFTNASGQNQYLAFSTSRLVNTGGVFHGPTTDIYSVRVSTNGGATILSENSATAAVRIDSADPNFAYNDRYPTWSPVIALTRIAFESDRTGNLRVNNFGTGFTGTPNVRDLFFASLVDSTAPTLIRFDTNSATGEIVHINLGNSYNPGGSVRTREDGLTPGTTVFFTVRCEDRESGLRDDADPAGGGVYLQFKNPNSMFQSVAQGGPQREFKDFLGTQFSIVELLNNTPIYIDLADINPGGQSVGYEYEAQVLGMDGVSFFSHSLSGGPVYTPGEDAQAFSGSVNPPLDGVHAATNCWLKLNRLPDAPADGQGGVLYGASFTLPSIPSDWYVDVIMYDNASNPFAPSAQRSNWIIYDNVWGFSTALPIAPRTTDVLFVSDYMLGQKFFGQRFGAGTRFNAPLNQQPIFFGAESFLTDTDPSRYPSEGPFAQAPPQPTTGTPTPRFYGSVGPFFRNDRLGGTGGFPRTGPGGVIVNPTYPNVLGVGSYTDNLTPFEPVTVNPVFGGTRRYALPDIGRYSIWRILSRGPLPQAILDAYLPQRTVAPADTFVGETSPRNLRIWNRLLVWASPFSGNLFVGPGSITDLRTQDALTRFVQSGGRMLITGADIGFALAGNGQSSNFFNNVLQAQWVSDARFQQPVGLTPGASSLITRDPFRNGVNARAYGRTSDGITWSYNPPLNGSNQLVLAPPFAPGRIPTASDWGDGSGTSNADNAYIDLVSSRANATDLNTTGVLNATEFAYNGASGIISAHYAENPAATLGANDPYARERKFLSGGSVVYATMGLESISQGWYVYTPQGGTNPILANQGRRSMIMANFTGAYRTGTITGRVIDDTGSPVPGALVRAVRSIGEERLPAWGTAITDASGQFTITGLPSEAYALFGYSPGYYTQHTAGILVVGTAIVRGDLQLKRANPGRLRNIPTSGTQTSGGVKDLGGNGIPGIEVQVRRTNPDGRKVAFSGVSLAPLPGTPAGSYELNDLQIGDYEVYVNWPTTLNESGTEVSNPRYNANYGSIKVDADPQADVTKGPGTVILPAPATAATRVVLRINEDQTSTLDFTLPGAPQIVRGKVIDSATGTGINGASVAATDANGNAIATATTDANGDYTLLTVGTPQTNRIPAGNYRVTATARNYNSASVDVTVGGAGTLTVPTLQLTKLPPGGVRGLVGSLAGTGGLSGVTVRMSFVLPDGSEDPIVLTQTTGATQTDSTGFVYNFEFTGVPVGDYILRFEKDGLVSDPVQVRITVTSGNITRVATRIRMQSPRVFGSGIQMVSVPFDYTPLFGANAPAPIFGLSASGDNDGDGVENTPADRAIFAAFSVADWTGLEYKIGNTVPILLGKGYFVRFGGVASVARTGSPNPASTFSLDLAPGWNLIGHPFSNRTNSSQPAPDLDLNTDLMIQDGTATPVTIPEAVRQGLVKPTLFGYTGSENGGQYLQTTVIKQWLGYWFRNSTSRTLKLIYTYPASRSVKTAARTITRAEVETITPRAIGSRSVTDWRLQLAARQGELMDTDNSIGVAREAKDGYDNHLDSQKPPMVTQVPSLYVAISGTDEAGRSVPFADVVRAPGGRKSWDITVQSARDGEVTLYWPGINRLPRGVEPQLTDIATGRKVRLRGAASYKFTATRGVAHAFRIDVAPVRTAPLAVMGTRVTSVGGTRGAGTSYRFAFTTTQEADVQVEVKTLTGRSLRQLTTRAVGGVESSVIWDGRDQKGAPLPAGTYILSLTARDLSGDTVRQNLPLTTVR